MLCADPVCHNPVVVARGSVRVLAHLGRVAVA